jgi:acyl CoA:acetate/3-ketoacid CoA transferase beta subunit
MLGVGPPDEDRADPDLLNAGKQPVTSFWVAHSLGVSSRLR